MNHLLPGFIGFLCCNKFTVLLKRNYDPTTHLSYSDIGGNDCDNLFLAIIYIKNPRWTLSVEGPALHWGNSEWNLPSKSTNALLSKTGFTSRPSIDLWKSTFPYTTGFPITPHKAVTACESGPFLLQYTQLQNWVATSAEAAGLTESQIKTVGRRKEAMLTAVTSSQRTHS